uniref:Solute carrier family 7 member 4 n=1 Tax=Molossus molossus TaxID=27622 RepID=A0A7J8BZV2_MOLMO|nr:solute carrier family 7 member 4 [Molossus molossus]
MDPGLPRTTGLVHICKKLNWLKPLEDPSMETSLWHCLSTLDLIFLGVGGMVGSDLYMLSGTMVKEMAGPAVLVSFGMAAVSSLLAAQCYADLDPDSILANAFYRWAYSWAGFIVVAGSIFIMNTVLPLNLLSGPQIIYAMAIDRLFSQAFAHVHPQTQVPMVGMLVFGVLIAFMALLLDLKVLVQFLSFVTLLVYTFVATTIIEFCFQKALQSSSLGQGSPGPVVKKYNFFQDHTQLVGTELSS